MPPNGVKQCEATDAVWQHTRNAFKRTVLKRLSACTVRDCDRHALVTFASLCRGWRRLCCNLHWQSCLPLNVSDWRRRIQHDSSTDNIRAVEQSLPGTCLFVSSAVTLLEEAAAAKRPSINSRSCSVEGLVNAAISSPTEMLFRRRTQSAGYLCNRLAAQRRCAVRQCFAGQSSLERSFRILASSCPCCGSSQH